jgi:hypothetical protein
MLVSLEKNQLIQNYTLSKSHQADIYFTDKKRG